MSTGDRQVVHNGPNLVYVVKECPLLVEKGLTDVGRRQHTFQFSYVLHQNFCVQGKSRQALGIHGNRIDLPLPSLKMVFCIQNCSELLHSEKKCSRYLGNFLSRELFIQTEGSVQFLKLNTFLACSCRLLRTNTLDYWNNSDSNWKKICNWDLEISRKSQKTTVLQPFILSTHYF